MALVFDRSDDASQLAEWRLNARAHHRLALWPKFADLGGVNPGLEMLKASLRRMLGE